MELIDAVFVVTIIMFSAVIHEVMHGVVADRLGDPTARLAGRLTLNPIPHLDPIGSIMLPIFFTLVNSPIFFGYAKPVPYNPYNLKPGRFSEAFVAGAGPASNAAIAILASLIIRLNIFPESNGVIFLIVVVNVMLCIFNLIPVPPLDGSKVFEALLPKKLGHVYGIWRRRMEYSPFMGMGIILIIIVVLGGAFGSFIRSIAQSLAGF